MKKVKEPERKKRGRPVTTGSGTQVQLRLQPGMLEAIDGWRDKLTRQEAIRRLVDWALNSPSITRKAK